MRKKKKSPTVMMDEIAKIFDKAGLEYTRDKNAIFTAVYTEIETFTLMISPVGPGDLCFFTMFNTPDMTQKAVDNMLASSRKICPLIFYEETDTDGEISGRSILGRYVLYDVDSYTAKGFRNTLIRLHIMAQLQIEAMTACFNLPEDVSLDLNMLIKAKVKSML